MINEQRAREIAEQFVGEHEQQFRYDYLGIVSVPRFPNEFNVSFTVTSPEGVEFEGPVVVIVDKTTEEVRFFESV